MSQLPDFSAISRQMEQKEECQVQLIICDGQKKKVLTTGNLVLEEGIYSDLGTVFYDRGPEELEMKKVNLLLSKTHGYLVEFDEFPCDGVIQFKMGSSGSRDAVDF